MKKKTNELAIASLAVSLAGLLIPYAPIVGVILGVIALDQIKRSPKKYDGRGLAKAGIAIGIVIMVMKVLLFLLYIVLAIFFVTIPFFFID